MEKIFVLIAVSNRMTVSPNKDHNGKPTKEVTLRTRNILVIILLALVSLGVAVGMIVYLTGISQSTEQNPMNTSPDNPVTICVTISIEDNVMTNTTRQWNVSVSRGTSLFMAMQTLEQQDSTFSFESNSTNSGPMITAINNITADASSMLWKILKAPDQYANTGLDGIIPEHGDHFIFRLIDESHMRMDSYITG